MSAHADAVLAAPLERRRLRVHGAVQGVGFRPFCARLANSLALAGWVRNDGAGVEIEVQGAPAALEAFVRRLVDEAPPLARIAGIESAPCRARAGERGFSIADSVPAGAPSTVMPPDVAVCEACLDELFDPSNRRYRHPFINCTHCGPRWTVTERLPYDRPNTSLARFALCPDCAGEYADAQDRRYHAQPIACPACGPRLSLLDAAGAEVPCGDPVAAAAQRLRAGAIVAIKGIGGYHLACDARNRHTLARLRQAKQRASKPFAVMCLNAASAALWAEVDEAARRLLHDPARPIVLLAKKPAAERALAAVAPGNGELGVMLPYTPLHWLLFHDLLGRPAGRAWRDLCNDVVLVMTSANPGGEPLAVEEGEALVRLREIADAFLAHDRAIVARCDDSVLRPAADGAPQFVRRARGYVPQPIALPGVPADAPPVLACGAWLKNTVCVTRGNEAFLSPHIGDLGSAASCAALAEAVSRLTDFLAVAPRVIAHDLHPDFFSTRFALDYARARGIPAVAVQHHHAHIAAVCAEHGVRAPVLGVALDGAGLGDDGTIWGGELLRVHGAQCSRVAHFAPLPLPGGDAAARAPWRMAAGVLHLLGRGGEIERRFAAHAAAPTVARMLARDLNCPRTSSAGRVFDAAAALLGLAEFNRHEAEAPLALEAAACAHGDAAPRPDAYRIADDGTLDLLPLLAWLADTDAAADARQRAAAVFHATLARAVAEWASRAARALGLSTIALGGGCWLNGRLRAAVVDRLGAQGFAVLQARAAPANDGGIALGQAWIALQGV
jgi:hydrogenase maturation protein HypF